ncbi:MAG: gliding motility-associated C-terminal domain-containing protein [Crocinitomicaceae bacterium]|nr:gliding motility-associated C-terminal domain-containing protein [Crocinitomicaceae bacterium]
MKKYLIAIIAIAQIGWFNEALAQQNLAAVNCSGAVPGCNLPNFDLSTNNSQDIQDFGTGGVSNPTTNPNAAPGNGGCLLTGETTSTFISIDIISSGTLEWSLETPGSTNCLDWIMWPNTPTLCTDLPNDAQAPVACNWNGACGGFTGMAAIGNLPAGASQNDFEYEINVVAGESYMLCLSNYSSYNGNCVFDFFGTAGVSCTPGTPDQTICLGDDAIVDIVISVPITTPTYTWLVTTGVSNPNSGVGVIVTPTVTTEYIVQIDDPTFTQPAMDTFLITVVTPQIPDAGLDQNVCLGDPIQLDGTQDDPANTILWLHDVSAVSPAPIVNYVPNQFTEDPLVSVNQVGWYEFIFRETNAICGDVYDTMVVVVSELTISATTVAPSCIGDADGEIHITSADAVEYSFDAGNNWIADSFAVNFTAGQYTVCGRTITGCMKCVVVDVVDPAPVTISVSNDTLICQNGTGYLSASATGGVTYTYHWDFTGDTQSAQAVNPVNATSYSVFAENEFGCVSPTETIDVTVRPPLTGTISNWDTVCPTYSTDLTATVIGGLGSQYTFLWSTTDTQSGPNNHTITVTPAATTTYTVTVTDACESTPLVMQTNVRVAPLPVPQYQVLDPEQCEPAVFHIVNTTDPTMSQYNYWWIEEDQQYVNSDTITTIEMYAGQYDMQMIVTSFEGCVDSLRFIDALDVKPKPTADFRYSPNPVLMFNTQVSFVNHSFNGDTYQWFFEDGYPDNSTQKNVQVIFPDGVTGAYDVMLITTSELGCVDTMMHELIVFPEVLIYAPNAFTPDGDEFNQNWRVYMEGVDVHDFELLIFDRWGEVVWESHDLEVGWDGTYKGRVIPAGTYQWIIRTKDILNDSKYTYNGHVNILR